jgi:hypothetical protein
MEDLPGNRSWVLFNIQETGLFLSLIYVTILSQVHCSIAGVGNLLALAGRIRLLTS